SATAPALLYLAHPCARLEARRRTKQAGARLRAWLRLDDVPVVHDVVRQLLRRDLAEAGALQVLARLRLAPHRAQALAALRQRDRHTVHAGDRVQQRAERMPGVLV